MSSVAEDFEVGLWNVDLATYHADPTDSHSKLDVLMDSPPLYEARFVTKTMPSPEPSDDMKLGTAFQVKCCQPELWGEQVAVMPKCDRRTNEGKKLWADFNASAGNKTVITEEQHVRIMRMVDAVWTHRVSRPLLEAPGLYEQPVRWIDPLTDHPLKCSFDKLIHGGPALDFKCSHETNPAKWNRLAGRYGYHRQSGLYVDGRWHGLEDPEDEFLFVVVGNQEPHEVMVCRLGIESVRTGRQQNARLIAECADRHRTGNWESRWQEVVEVDLPPWDLRED